MGSGYRRTGELPNLFLAETALEKPTTEGDSPVGEKKRSLLSGTRVSWDKGSPVRIKEDHLLRLNTNW
jgi:hypothetical protein